MLLVQLILYLAIFTGMVAFSVRGGAVNGLFFYPKPVQERTFAIGLMDPKRLKQKRQRFMLLFYLVMLATLTGIIGVWNWVNDFKTAYLQALLFLEVMNWYDGIIIDRLWVGHSKFWVLPGTEDLPFVQTWKQVFQKRGLLTIVMVFAAAVVGGLVMLLAAFLL